MNGISYLEKGILLSGFTPADFPRLEPNVVRITDKFNRSYLKREPDLEKPPTELLDAITGYQQFNITKTGRAMPIGLAAAGVLESFLFSPFRDEYIDSWQRKDLDNFYCLDELNSGLGAFLVAYVSGLREFRGESESQAASSIARVDGEVADVFKEMGIDIKIDESDEIMAYNKRILRGKSYSKLLREDPTGMSLSERLVFDSIDEDDKNLPLYGLGVMTMDSAYQLVYPHLPKV